MPRDVTAAAAAGWCPSSRDVTSHKHQPSKQHRALAPLGHALYSTQPNCNSLASSYNCRVVQLGPHYVYCLDWRKLTTAANRMAIIPPAGLYACTPALLPPTCPPESLSPTVDAVRRLFSSRRRISFNISPYYYCCVHTSFMFEAI